MALDKYDDEADTIAPGGKAGLKAIPDGEFEAEIESAEVKEARNGTDLFKMKILVLDGPAAGRDFDHDFWLTSKDKDTGKITLNDVKVGILKKDLKTIGFDTDNWKKDAGRPLSRELPKAALLLPGLRFKAKKSTNGEYANLTIIERNAASDHKPANFGPAELEAAAKANENPFGVD